MRPLASSASVPSLTAWPLITDWMESPLQVISYWFHAADLILDAILVAVVVTANLRVAPFGVNR